MTTRGDVTSEIKDALDREVARRFDTRRLLAGIERRALRQTIAHAPEARRHRAGPLGALPVAVQWAGVGAAFLGAVLGVRALYLESTRVAPTVAEARPPATAVGPLVADATPSRETATLPVPARPTRPTPGPRSAARQPVPEAVPEGPPSLPVPRQAEAAPPPSRPTAVTRNFVPVPSPAPPAPRPTAPQRPGAAGAQTGPVIVSGPPNPLGWAGLIGGVHVKSFRFGGKDMWPEVREVHEIGATLVLASAAGRAHLRPHAPRDAVIPAFDTHTAAPRFLLAAAPRPDRQAATAPLGITPGAYYARLFLGSRSDANSRGQGLMGDGLQVVPLREDEVWGDEAQERFLRRSFGLKSVVAVDGAQVPPAADAEDTGTSFTAGVGGQIFGISLRGSADDQGLHTIDLRISRQIDRQTHPESHLDDLEATLVVQNGRIAILGLPGRDPDRHSPTIAFLALSPRFAEFAAPEDTGDVRLLDDDVEPPVLIDRAEIEYPQQARELRVGGKVILQAVIRKDGTVDGIQVLRVPEVPGSEYLVEAAASSVRNWRYLPARVDGEPIHVYFTIVVDFAVRQD